MENELSNIEVRPIVGYEDLYEVTSEGDVYSFKTGKWVKLNPKVVGGYQLVGLSKGGKQCQFYVHRLVADAFIPNPDSKPQIDHINTIKSDNRVENLRWVTPKENSNNPITLTKLRSRLCSEEYIRNQKESRRKKFHDPEYIKYKEVERKNKRFDLMKSDLRFVRKFKPRVLCIESQIVFDSIESASQELNLFFKRIAECCLGERQTTGGYHFRFVD